MTRRQVLIVSALVATLLAVAFAPGGGGDVVAPVARAAARSSETLPRADAASTRSGKSAAVQRVEVLRIHPRLDVDESSSPFYVPSRVTSRAVAPAKQPEPAAPEPPAAMTLPFRAIGRYVDGDVETLFLQHGEQTINVRIGDTHEHYRLETSSAGVLTFVHLPTNTRHTLDFGETP